MYINLKSYEELWGTDQAAELRRLMNPPITQEENSVRQEQQVNPQDQAETPEEKARGDVVQNHSAFLLHNWQLFFKTELSLNVPYSFRVEQEIKDFSPKKANYIYVYYNNYKTTLRHKVSELFVEQFSNGEEITGEHEFIFYLNENNEIRIKVDGKEFIIP